MINDVVPAALIGRFFGLFRAISLIVGGLLNHFLLGKAEDHFLEIFVVMGLIYGVGFGLMCLNAKEGEYSVIYDSGPREGSRVAVKRYCRECFTHPYYLWLFGHGRLRTLPSIRSTPSACSTRAARE